ncbi:MAG TPA: hypothetical protein VM900_01380 [Sphingomonas sp.]|nr:hypothetical protein [Sphingomonas sp.]
MDERDEATDEGLEHCQGPALYPLGRALRTTFHAENHDSLSADVTALMLDLSRVPFEPCATNPAGSVGAVGAAAKAAPLPVVAPATARAVAPSFFARVRMLLLG